MGPRLSSSRFATERRRASSSPTFVGGGQYDVAVGKPDAPSARLGFEVLGGHALRLSLGGSTLRATAVPDGARLHVFASGARCELDVVDPLYVESNGDSDSGGLRAPMPGKVIAHIAAEGAKVEKGAPLMVLEAMKMELTISAPRAGVVKRFVYGVGEQVSEGAELVVLEEEAEEKKAS